MKLQCGVLHVLHPPSGPQPTQACLVNSLVRELNRGPELDLNTVPWCSAEAASYMQICFSVFVCYKDAFSNLEHTGKKRRREDTSHRVHPNDINFLNKSIPKEATQGI